MKIHGKINGGLFFILWKMASKENCAFRLYTRKPAPITPCFHAFIPALLISVDAESLAVNAQPCSPFQGKWKIGEIINDGERTILHTDKGNRFNSERYNPTKKKRKQEFFFFSSSSRNTWKYTKLLLTRTHFEQ